MNDLKINDIVEVRTSSKYYYDWKGCKVIIIGINKIHEEIEYTVNDDGCVYDGFKENELAKINQP